LRAKGVTHVAVEGHLMPAAAVARVAEFPELALWATDGNLRIYRLK
jgi:hypothetical protein